MTSLGLYLTVCFFCLCRCSATSGYGDFDYPNNYPFYPPDRDVIEEVKPKPNSLRHRSGSSITLKCNITICHNRKKVYWEFKGCKPDKTVPCGKQHGLPKKINAKENASWKRIVHLNNNKCALQLKISNATETHSGVYNCIENNTVIESFEVEVVDGTKYGGQPPEILDVEFTVPQNDEAVIKCRVYSERPPVIIWLKEIDEVSKDTVQYFGKYYKTIKTTHDVYAMPSKTDEYLSKLYIPDLKTLGNGMYVCFAISESGKAIKAVTVEVESSPEEVSDDTSFSFLFLIPLPLVLVPIIFWLCYYRKNIKVQINGPTQPQQAPLVRPILDVNQIKCQT